VGQGRGQVTPTHGQGHRADPVVEAFAQVVDGQFLQGQQHQGLGAVGQGGAAHRPAAGRALAGEALAGEGGQGGVEEGMPQVQQGRVTPWAEDGPSPHVHHQALGVEDQARQDSADPAPLGQAQGVVHQARPRAGDGMHQLLAALLIRGGQAGQARAHAHGLLQGVAQGRRVQVQLGGERLQGLPFLLAAPLDFQAGDVGPAPGPLQMRLQVGADGRGRSTLDQPALHGPVEDVRGRAQVLADGVDLAGHVGQEGQVVVGLGVEVEDGDVAGLAVTVQAAVALLEAGRVPGDVAAGSDLPRRRPWPPRSGDRRWGH